MIKDYIESYDKQFRNKSLVEIHQEKLRQQKSQNKAQGIRKPFNKEADFALSGKIDSKTLFQAYQQNDVLTSKFTSGKYV